MKLIKQIILTIGLLAPLAAFSQAYWPQQSILNGTTNQLPIGGTNAAPTVVLGSQQNQFNVPPNTSNTNSYPPVVFGTVIGNVAPASRFLAVSVTQTASGASTANTTFYFSSSIDYVNWATNAWSFSFAQNGTKPTTLITNLDTQGTPYWALTAVTNAAGTVYVTNLTVTASRQVGGGS